MTDIIAKKRTKVKTVDIKILEAIETIVSDGFCEDLEWDLFKGRLNEREKELAKRIGRIYEISHANNPNHSCHFVHGDWRGETRGDQTK